LFSLYPGGGFGIEQPEIDEKMKRIFGSANFRSVIVTQPIVRDYLISENLCPKDKIFYVYGGVIPRTAFDVPPEKHRYGIGKKDLDICFVANRYTPVGADKGYDLFVDAAKGLLASGVSANFQVVGKYDKDVIELGEAAGRMHFHGFQTREFFRDFYRRMDLILGPTRPFVLAPGLFDGFPTGACVEAGLQSVAVLCSDELKQNTMFRDGEEIIIVRPDKANILAHLQSLVGDPQRLASIGEKGRARMLEVFGRDAQIEPRLRLLRSLRAG
jgi:glycosyltransferase involved in cell wall biosynthesis